ncbi:MAG TPA: PDC sensor domain-containing protein [Vicinamibacteria bacterium]
MIALRRLPLAAALLALTSAPLLAGLLAQVDAAVRQSALARLPKAKLMAQDPELVQAVAAKNLQKETEAQIRDRDRKWSANESDPLRRSLSEGACAQRLRELAKDDAVVVEVILMDERGANVCSSRPTSDYWQGDEAKWQKTFKEGIDPFVDAPTLDESTGVYAIQVSVPVRRDGSSIGALTLTLKIPRAQVQPPAKP